MIWSQEKYGIPAVPNYGALTGADVFDATGLRVNSTNANGTVDVNGNVTVWKSLINSGKTFAGINSKGNANLVLDKIKRGNVVLNRGAGIFRQASAVQSRTDFSYLWFHASGYASMRWTVHCLARWGMSDGYGNIVPIIANNRGGNGTRPGVMLYQADRLAGASNDKSVIIITKNSAGNINTVSENGVIPSGVWGVVTIEMDGSLGATNSLKLYYNGVAQTIVNSSSSTSVNITNLDALEIMGLGDSAFTLESVFMSHLIIQNVVESAGVRGTIISELQAWATYFNAENARPSTSGQLNKAVEEGRYYLTTKIIQDVVDDNKLCALFTNGTSAGVDTAKRLSMVKSTDYGKTWGVIATVSDPAGNDFLASQSAGVTPANKYVCVYATRDLVPVCKLWYTYSTDQGATWQTPVDISSVIPSDGLAFIQVETQVIVNNGRIMFTLDKQTSNVSTAQSANYLIYSDDDGATWNSITIRAPHADYVTEASMVHLGGNDLYLLIGSYADNQWRNWTSGNNGTSWTYNGLIDFDTTGSGIDSTPSTLHKFKINNTEIVAFYYYVHTTFVYRVAYALASECLTNPLGAWPDSLKQVRINQFFMHGDFCHFNDSIEAIYVSPLQPDTFTGITDSLAYGSAPQPLGEIIAEFGL
ncbi:MAG TPA: sialidase family protein [Chryseolinea sp.]|nr:sialidase family protein [Chryseolinea sp.]